jgi:hypothetical protein
MMERDIALTRKAMLWVVVGAWARELQRRESVLV